MIYPRRALLEDRSDDDNASTFGQLLEGLRRRPWNWFCQIKKTVILTLAEVLRTKQFLGANDLCTLPGSLFRRRQRFFKIGARARAAGGLDKTDANCRPGIEVRAHRCPF